MSIPASCGIETSAGDSRLRRYSSMPSSSCRVFMLSVLPDDQPNVSERVWSHGPEELDLKSSMSCADGSKAVDVDHGLSKLPRGLLRYVVADAAGDEAILILA